VAIYIATKIIELFWIVIIIYSNG